jgi:SAM-dependent methyltransferase
MLAQPLRHLYNRCLFHVGRRIRNRHVLAAIDAWGPAGGRVLDAGCGSGDLALALARRRPHLDIEGVELEPAKAAAGERRARDLGVPNLKLRAGDITRIDRSQHYDLAMSVDVLEHVPDDAAALQALARALRPGGLLILHTPRSVPRRFLARFDHHHQEDHVRDGYEAADLSSRLVSAGFSDIRIRHTFGPAGEIAWEIMQLVRGEPPSRARELAGVVLSPLLLLLCELDFRLGGGRKGNGLLVIARRAPVPMAELVHDAVPAAARR